MHAQEPATLMEYAQRPATGGIPFLDVPFEPVLTLTHVTVQLKSGVSVPKGRAQGPAVVLTMQTAGQA